MRIPRPDLATLAVGAIALVGIILLAALRIPAPDVLAYVALGALTGGAGIALNTPNGKETLPRAAAAPAPARSSAVPAQRPAPAPNGAPVGAPGGAQ